MTRTLLEQSFLKVALFRKGTMVLGGRWQHEGCGPVREPIRECFQLILSSQGDEIIIGKIISNVTSCSSFK